jgi:hypothetical protein
VAAAAGSGVDDGGAAAGLSEGLARVALRVRRALQEDPAPALLIALPVLLLALNSQWLWSGPHRDAWLYYGYFQNGLDYLRTFPNLYYGSRLSVIVPGWSLHHLLPVWAANVVLHLGLYWLAILSFYSTARELFGGRAGLLASVVLGCQTFFLFAMGWNYVDGFGIGYFLLALALLTHAARSPGRTWRLVLAGAAACAMVAANIGYLVYVAPLGLAFVVLNHRGAQRALVPALGWFAGGAALVFLLLCAVSRAAGGPWFFLEPSVSFVREFVPRASPFRDATYRWVRGAHHLAFPAAIALASVAVLLRGLRRATRPPYATLLASSLLILVGAGISWGQLLGDTSQLQYFYYSSFLTPLAALALAGMLASRLDALTRTGFFAVVGAAVVCLGVPLLLRVGPLPGLRELSIPPTLWSLMAGLLALTALSLARGPRLAILGLVALLGVQAFLVKEIPGHFRRPGSADGRAAALFLQMDRAMSLIDRSDPERASKLWYDMPAEYGGVYDAIACGFTLFSRVVNVDFPALGEAVLANGDPLEPSLRIVVLSDQPAAFERAAAALEGIGLGGRLVDEMAVSGPVPHFKLTFLEVTPGAGAGR